MRVLICFSLALAFLASPVQASYLEICKFEGLVKKSPKIKNDAVIFKMKVKISTPAKCRTAESDDPKTCQSYLNRSLKVALPVENSSSVVAGSNVVIVQRVWYADAAPNPGTRVSWQLSGDCN